MAIWCGAGKSEEDEKKELKNILFGYAEVPACGFTEQDDGGFSVAVYKNGKLIYRTYIFCEIVKTEVEYKISDKSISAIKALMKWRKKTIDAFEDHLHNGSFDGSFNYFVFNGKQIWTKNIFHTPFFLLPFCKEYYSALKQHNKMLSLFFAITRILKRDGIRLKLEEVNFNNEDNE